MKKDKLKKPDMRIIGKTGKEDIATVYIGELKNGKKIEFVESVQPPIPRNKKWVLIVSTLCGCPVGCRFCDAGGYYQGKLTKEEIITQIDYLVKNRFLDRKVPVEKFKIQFARMGEPAFNENVLDVLVELPNLYDAPGLIPSISTIAPEGTDNFFKKLIRIKNRHYKKRFQFQFSIHTTDLNLRDWLVPTKKWNFEKMAQYGKLFYEKGDRKIALNFALADGMPVDAGVLSNYFDPERFLIKITPVNPTYQAVKNKISSYVRPDKAAYPVIDELQKAGYEVILSIGEWEENLIGSNCGQYILKHINEPESIKEGYTYEIQRI